MASCRITRTSEPSGVQAQMLFIPARSAGTSTAKEYDSWNIWITRCNCPVCDSPGKQIAILKA